MINKPSPVKGLNVRIPITILIKGRGFINHGSGLSNKLTGPKTEFGLEKCHDKRG